MTPEYVRMVELGRAAKAAERAYTVGGVGIEFGKRRQFDDPEHAIRFAVRSARVTGLPRSVYQVDGAGLLLDLLAYVSPRGQVDLTWRGSELISCNPKAQRGASS